MGAPTKWIDGLAPDTPVNEAARRSLEPRLVAVSQLLPAAAYLAEQDIEHVHRLRVATRRAMAALRLYEELLPRKHAKWMKKQLKKIRRAAGDARDLDVMAKRLKKSYGDDAAAALAIARKERSSVQPKIKKVAERCRREDRYIRKTAKLLPRIGYDGAKLSDCSFGDFASSKLEHAVRKVLDAVPHNLDDTAALHQLRICAKALRYTIELVADAFDRSLRRDYYPLVEEVQERLGTIQDHVAARNQLQAWSEKTENADEQQKMHLLAENESNEVANAVNDFRNWWSAERQQQLVQISQFASGKLPTDADSALQNGEPHDERMPVRQE